MALAPKYAAQVIQSTTSSLGGGGSTLLPNTIECFLDYVCPFSAKMWSTLIKGGIIDKIQNDEKYKGKVRIILRQQIQPWHPSSTLTHEAALAVMQIDPKNYIKFSTLLYENQKDYFDVNVVNETRNETYKKLASLANQVGIDQKKVLDLLYVSDKPAKDGSLNIGNQVTNDVKYITKTNRMLGVHVTPTVVFNGVVENSISSSFTEQQWLEWLDKNLVSEHL